MRSEGFTLIEIIVAMGITAIVAFIVSNFSFELSRLSDFTQKSLQNQQSLDQTLRLMVTEMRSMGLSSLGSYPLLYANATSATFYSDIDEDGLFEQVRYYIASSTFEKGVIKPIGNPLKYATSSELIETVIANIIFASSSFYYYDTNYTGAETPINQPVDVSKVRAIRIKLSADVNPGESPTPTVFDSTVTPRNLKTN